MNLYKSSEITVHQLNDLKQDNSKIQIIDVEDTERSCLLWKQYIRNSQK